MELKTRIDAWVDAHRDEFLADLTRLVAVESTRTAAEPGMPFGPGPAKALEVALDICSGYGFAVKNYENYVGTADLNDKETIMDILGHLDVVDAGDGWDTDPFTAVLKEDGCFYGRGTDDDKGPTLAALYAMRCIRDLEVPCTKNVRLIMGTDEESGFEDLTYYYTVEQPAPNTFTPDAQFPVYNTEKGHYRPAVAADWDAESALPRVTGIQGGIRINVVPAQAKAQILGLSPEQVEAICAPMAAELGVSVAVTAMENGARLEVYGRSAHASTPELGQNAITALLRLLSALPLADCESTRAILGLNTAFPHGDVTGKALGIAQRDELSGDLTVAFSLLEMTGTGLRGQADSRTSVCATEENCKAICEKTLSDLGFTVSGEMDASHHTPADTPFVQTLLASYTECTGNPGECLSMGGGTYVHHIPGGVAFGAGMPGFESNLHGANERVEVESILTAIKIFARVIAGMAV